MPVDPSFPQEGDALTQNQRDNWNSVVLEYPGNGVDPGNLPVFFNTVEISPPTGAAVLELKAVAAAEPVAIELEPTSGSPDARHFRLLCGGGSYFITSTLDDGTQVAVPITFAHNGDVEVGGVLSELTINIQYPQPLVVNGGTFTPDLSSGNAPYVHVIANSTINPPAANSISHMTFLIDDSVDVTLVGYTELEARNGTGVTLSTIVVDENDAPYWAWGPAA